MRVTGACPCTIHHAPCSNTAAIFRQCLPIRTARHSPSVVQSLTYAWTGVNLHGCPKREDPLAITPPNVILLR
jgi:hypothetical protein